MPLFSATAAEMIRGRVVHIALLAELQFASQTMRLWTGFRSRTMGGYEWQAIGDFGNVGNIALGPGLPVEPFVLTLSGLAQFGYGNAATLDAILQAQRTEVYGRKAKLFTQCFNADWSTLDNPVRLRTGIMDRMTRDTDPGREGTHVIRLYCEPRTVDKHRAIGSMLTHKDQQRRYPADLGLERMASISRTGNKEW